MSSSQSRLVRAIHEDRPGDRWKTYLREYAEAYERWFLAEGEWNRPTYLTSRRMLRYYMPEMIDLYDELVELAGGGDRIARILSLYKPTPFMSGCSQVVWTGEEPILIRNYDYSPALWEAAFWSAQWLDKRIIFASDCLWGALDGMNEDGLVVSLSFGGRKILGDGFGIPIVLRYLLEICENTEEALLELTNIPINMAYNVTIVDQEGSYATAWLAPDRDPIIRRWPISTNHQETNDWPEYVSRAGSVEREKHLAAILGDPRETPNSLKNYFLHPPLYQTNFQKAYGTLYTAIYYPWSRSVEYHWPQASMRQSFDNFEEKEFWVHFYDFDLWEI